MQPLENEEFREVEPQATDEFAVASFGRRKKATGPKPIYKSVAPVSTDLEEIREQAERERRIAEFSGLSPITSRILAARGFEADQKLTKYLQPSLDQLPDKWSMLGLKKAVALLTEAVIEKKKIALCCDYDVDGTTSASILYRALKALGARVDIYPSRRFTDGYSITEQNVRDLAEKKIDLMVTLDFGTKNFKQLSLAKKLGIETIVVDHHHKPEGPKLPVNALINPKQDGCGYHEEDLCTAGLAWVVASALKEKLERSRGAESRDARVRARQLNTNELLAYAALGTVADVVQLRDANRVIVQRGLLELSVTTHKGLRALKEQCNLKAEVLSEDVGFKMGPRNNAVGRLVDTGAKVATDLYTTEHLGQARENAQFLTEKNEQRKSIERENFKKVDGEIKKLPKLPSVLVIAREDLHEGVVGIVASRIVERYNRPTFILTKSENGTFKGSGRGMDLPGLHLAEALEDPRVKEWIAKVDGVAKAGGHKRAAGVTIPAENIDRFRKALQEVVSEQLKGVDTTPLQKYDVEVTLAEINAIGPKLMEELKVLEPSGERNPAAKLCVRNVTVISTQSMDNQHLKVLLRQDSVRDDGDGKPSAAFIYGMLWFNGEHPVLKEGARVDLVAKPKLETRHANYNPENQSIKLDIIAASPSQRAQ